MKPIYWSAVATIWLVGIIVIAALNGLCVWIGCERDACGVEVKMR